MANPLAISRRINAKPKDPNVSATARAAGLSNARKDNIARPIQRKLKNPAKINQRRFT